MVTRESLGELPDYPFESHFLALGRERMHFVDEGPRSAPVTVMVHGNPTWSFYFRRLILGLRYRYRCIALDHIGMGLSSRPSDGRYEFSLAQRVSDLETLLNLQVPDGPLTLILHDWGGLIGMSYAARHPERIGRLVLLNTGAFTLPRAAGVPWQIRAFRSPIGHLLAVELNAFCQGAARLCSNQGLSAEIRRAYLAPYTTWSDRQAVLRFVQDIPIDARDPGYPLVQQVESAYSQFAATPTLLLWGMKDFVFTGKFLQRFCELLPHAAVHRFPDAGHYLLEDEPTHVLARVAAFLDSDEEALKR